MKVQYFLRETHGLLMEPATWASKAPQKHCSVHAAPRKKLQNHLAQLRTAKEMGMLTASQQSP